MIGLPLLVGAAMFRMDRAGAHSDPNYVQSFGWVYGACEAHVFYYGWFSILRRTAFVLIGKCLDDPLAQSTAAIVLVSGLWVAHVKLEPFKGNPPPGAHTRAHTPNALSRLELQRASALRPRWGDAQTNRMQITFSTCWTWCCWAAFSCLRSARSSSTRRSWRRKVETGSYWVG